MLNVLEPLDLGSPNSYQSIHLMAETMRRAYADRAAYLGDADFVSVPVADLTSPKYAAKLREANAIQPRKRPLSSMTPTIVLQEDRDSGLGARDSEKKDQPRSPGFSFPRPEPRVPSPGLVLGSPGGGTIINTVLEVLLNVLVIRMAIGRAHV